MLKDDYLPGFLCPAKISLRTSQKIKIFPDEGKLRICPQKIYPNRIAKDSTLYKKKMIKEGSLEYQKGKKNIMHKVIGKYVSLSSSWVF